MRTICYANLRQSQKATRIPIIILKVFRNLLINLTNNLFEVTNIWGKTRNFNFERNFLQRHCLKSFALKNFCHRFAIFPKYGTNERNHESKVNNNEHTYLQQVKKNICLITQRNTKKLPRKLRFS